MQRTERFPLLFPRTLMGVAAGKERGISLCFLYSLLLRIRNEWESASASNVRIRSQGYICRRASRDNIDTSERYRLYESNYKRASLYIPPQS